MASKEPSTVCEMLKNEMKTLQLSTVGENGEPHCGYTPYIVDGATLVVFVSQLAVHTRDMLSTSQAAAMIITDEQSTGNLFARCRVSYQCKTEQVEITDPEYTPLLDRYHERHGKMVALLRQLPDFVLIRLAPYSGQFVMGFGKAYRLEGEKLDSFVHARTG